MPIRVSALNNQRGGGGKMKLVITKEEKEKNIHAISRMLNDLSFHEADEIFNEARSPPFIADL